MEEKEREGKTNKTKLDLIKLKTVSLTRQKRKKLKPDAKPNTVGKPSSKSYQGKEKI